LLTLSRPFLTLPCPFLCAMRLFLLLGLGLLRFRSLPAQADAGNFHPCQFAAMSDRPVITFPTTILERDDFLVLALLDDFAGDGRPLDKRCAVRDLIAVSMKKDVGEDTFFAGFLIEEIDIDDVAFRDAMLSAASFDNCVSHTKKPGATPGEKPRKVPQVRRFDKRELRCPPPHIKHAFSFLHAANDQRYFPLCWVSFIVGQQLDGRSPAELLEFLRELAGDAQLPIGHQLSANRERF
jgi:hypothetical protein